MSDVTVQLGNKNLQRALQPAAATSQSRPGQMVWNVLEDLDNPAYPCVYMAGISARAMS
jgi:hypothetical protein